MKLNGWRPKKPQSLCLDRNRWNNRWVYYSGIDTGGTYTDAVVAPLSLEQILAQAKTPTTHGNLAVGIETVLEKIRGVDFAEVLIAAVSRVLHTRGIKAPLMITRGDASMIGQDLAQERPIETVLSGPAASVLGARVLSGVKDAIVIDMGGTTTDIAVLHQGSPVLNSAGALVGDWQTGIQTVDVTTVGIGGDSHITRAKNGSLNIGPRRAIPLCMAASRHPSLVAVLRRLAKREGRNLVVPRGDFLGLGKSALGYKLKCWEQELLASLADGPRNVYDLASQLGLAHPLLLRPERLEMLGLVQRIGFTPTDALHASGVYCQWDVEAAKLGANILGKSLGLSEMELTHRVNEEVVNRIALAVLRHLLSYEIPRKQVPGGLFGDWVVRKSFSADADLVECRLRVRKKIVGVGAAAKAFLPAVADKLHTECVIPPYAEVANAVGTVAGNISQTAEALVRPQFLGSQLIGYLLTAPNGRQTFLLRKQWRGPWPSLSN